MGVEMISVSVWTMSAVYSDTLQGPERERYARKLLSLRGLVPNAECLETALPRLDPYRIPAEEWIDNVKKWPPLEFGHIYVYLIETPGEFTREKLKAYKSLEAYNYYARYFSYCK